MPHEAAVIVSCRVFAGSAADLPYKQLDSTYFSLPTLSHPTPALTDTSFQSTEKIGRLCRATAASFYVNTSLRAERNELNPFMKTFIY